MGGLKSVGTPRPSVGCCAGKKNIFNNCNICLVIFIKFLRMQNIFPTTSEFFSSMLLILNRYNSESIGGRAECMIIEKFAEAKYLQVFITESN